MSFPAAFQSAIFYFLACTPCNSVRHRHKVKVEAKKEKKEKAKLEMEQPGLYRHPSPYNTNPYWQDEIRMGPSLPKKSASKNSSQRGLMSAGGESSVSVSDRTLGGDVVGPAESRAHFDESLTAMVEVDMLSDDWNKRRGYQREDEELWGEGPGHLLIDAFSKARDSAGKLIVSTLGKDSAREPRHITDDDRRAFYAAPRNPPVNDYHPPVVSSKPLHRDAHKWMLQPPPSAKVMEGKVPVCRTASSGSKSSGKTTLVGDDTHLSRLLHDKLLREKLLLSQPHLTADEEHLFNSLFNLHDDDDDDDDDTNNKDNNSASQPLHRSRSLSFEAAGEMIDTALYFDRPKSKGRLRRAAAPEPESEDEFEDIFAPRVAKSASQSSGKSNNLRNSRSTRSSRSARAKLARRQMSTRMRRQLASPVGDDSD